MEKVSRPNIKTKEPYKVKIRVLKRICKECKTKKDRSRIILPSTWDNLR